MKEREILRDGYQNYQINWEQDRAFLLLYQRAVLLALKDQGILNEQQYHHAERQLRMQQGGDCAK